VSLLSPGRGLRGASLDELAGHGGAVWRVTAEIATAAGRRSILTERLAGASGRRVEIDGKPAAQTALAGLVRILWLTPALDRLFLEAPAERRRYLDRVAMSLVPGHAETALLYERALRERNRMLRDGVTDSTWYDVVERRMAEAGARLTAGRQAAIARLAAAQKAGPFPVARLALASEAPEAAGDLGDALAAGRRRDMAAGRTLVGPHRDDLAVADAGKDMPARLCSTGEQKALILSLALANARAVEEAWGEPAILLLDEVAAHLDAARRAALFAAIAALGAQTWMTGTERALFAPLEGSATFLAIEERDGQSRLCAPSASA
jgi:DNA replication and repair protein RecF